MDSSLYAGLSRQVVLRRAMDTVANNVANASTPGYRAQNPMFKEFISDKSGQTTPLSLVLDSGQYLTTAPGPSQFTGGTYDVALQGPGFIEVKTLTGEIMYTRAGNFAVDATGELKTSGGFQVGNVPIIIPQGTKRVTILEDGSVVADESTVGRITMSEFDNLQSLRPEGNGLYSSPVPGTPALKTTMKQGMLEGSNVNTVSEMARMIEVSREYERTMNMIKNEGDRQVTAIQRMSKMSQ